MKTANSTNTAKPSPPLSGLLWLLSILIVGVCATSFCLLLLNGGLLLRRAIMTEVEGDQQALAVSTTSPTRPAETIPASPTPSKTVAPTATARPTASATPTTRPTVDAKGDSSEQAGQSEQADPPLDGPCEDLLLTAGSSITEPVLSPISFSSRGDDQGWPLDAANQLSVEIDQLRATFSFAGLEDGLPWQRIWYFGRQEISRGEGVWDAGEQGMLTVHAAMGAGGFLPGHYRLEIYVDGTLLTEGRVTLISPDQPAEQPIQLMYTTQTSTQTALNLLNLETNERQPLLTSALHPTFSPDGQVVLFYATTDFEAGSAGLWRMSLQQLEPTQLLTETAFQSFAWAPNSNYVVSWQNEANHSRLALFALAEGAEVYPGPLGKNPAWSPDGQRVVFQGCDQAGPNLSIVQVVGPVFVVETLQRLTDQADLQPAWSWDGRQIAFVRRQDDLHSIYTISPDGQNLHPLTAVAGDDFTPVWTPDNRLVFRSLRQGKWGLYIMDRDGANLRRLGDAPLLSAEEETAWQPDRPAVSSNILPVEPPPPKPNIAMPPGQGILLVSNRNNNDEMTFTIADHEHKIGPHQVGQIPLPSGQYTWTASWPGKESRNGRADIRAGEIAYPVIER